MAIHAAYFCSPAIKKFRLFGKKSALYKHLIYLRASFISDRRNEDTATAKRRAPKYEIFGLRNTRTSKGELA